jgi:hypothetical protein
MLTYNDVIIINCPMNYILIKFVYCFCLFSESFPSWFAICNIAVRPLSESSAQRNIHCSATLSALSSEDEAPFCLPFYELVHIVSYLSGMAVNHFIPSSVVNTIVQLSDVFLEQVMLNDVPSKLP